MGIMSRLKKAVTVPKSVKKVVKSIKVTDVVAAAATGGLGQYAAGKATAAARGIITTNLKAAQKTVDKYTKAAPKVRAKAAPTKAIAPIAPRARDMGEPVREPGIIERTTAQQAVGPAAAPATTKLSPMVIVGAAAAGLLAVVALRRR